MKILFWISVYFVVSLIWGILLGHFIAGRPVTDLWRKEEKDER